MKLMTTLPSYVLITPARNEAKLIELTIKSVVAQTVRPLKWVIVSDGSTDGTDDIVQKYVTQYPWIELLKMPERNERHFAGKVLGFRAGYQRVKQLHYDVVCSLDADISFDQEYFAFLLQKLAGDPKLGLVGTPFKDSSVSYDYRFVSIEHVSGACQVFRRECFEQIGGYVAARAGAIDRIANIASRMEGWKTRTFTGKFYVHHRELGSAQGGLLRSSFRDGIKDYSVGTHPVWMLFRVSYKVGKKPYIIGAVALAWGYVRSYLQGNERPIAWKLVEHNRREQMQRLKRFLTGDKVRAYFVG
jgi:glycosyltransferase involved in cell wall biosynthesis